MARRKREEAQDAPAIDLAIPLPAEGEGSLKFWFDEIEQSERRIKKEIPNWRENLERYEGGRARVGKIRSDEIITVNTDFTNTEQKKGQLFFQTPFVQLTPKLTACIQAAPLAQAVLNDKLGRNGVKAKALMDLVLLDVLCPAGLGPTKIGYERVDAPVQVPTLDAMGQPVIDPATMQPVLETVPKKIYDCYYWERISPADLRVPVQFLSTDFEEAPWIGHRFRVTDKFTSRYKLRKKDYGGASFDADLTLARASDREFMSDVSYGYEIFYKASLYHEDVLHPDVVYHLVILKTSRKQEAIIHELCPFQRYDAATATLNGMIGFPIHVFTTRTVSDSAYPKSDCAIGRQTTDELSSHRTMMVQQRRRNIPLRTADKNRVDKAVMDRLERAEVQGIIPIDGPQHDIFGIVPQATFPPENFTINEIVQRDNDKQWALGANQQGVTQETTRSATEIGTIERAVQTRMSNERGRILEQYIAGAEKVLALYQLFADHEDNVEIVGEDGASRLETWDRTRIQGRFGFSAKPESTQRIDAAEERELYLRAYNLLANDPNVNRAELVRTIAMKFDMDPAKVMQAPPPPPPEQPKISISVRAELNDPIILELLQQNGQTISPEAVANSLLGQQAGILPMPKRPQTQHGGAAQEMEPVSKHDAALTGQRTGPKTFA